MGRGEPEGKQEQAALRGSESFCPVSRKLKQLEASVPEDLGPEQGRCRELSQPSPPRRPRSSGPCTQANSSAAPSAPTPGPPPAIGDPCGQEHSPTPCYSGLRAHLSTRRASAFHSHSRLWAFGHAACSAWNALTTPSSGLARFHLTFRSLLLFASSRKPSLTALLGSPLPGFITITV